MKNSKKKKTNRIKANILFVLVILLFTSCYSPRVFFENKKNKSNFNVNRVNKYYKLNDKKYSLLILTDGYNKTKIQIINNEKIFDTLVTSQRSMGLATAIRINNNYDVLIIDKTRNIKLKLNKEYLKKYKYIYVGYGYKNIYTRKKKYNITYSKFLHMFS